MVTTQTATTPTHRIDGLGGVRCGGCGQPMFKVAPSPGSERPQGVVFLRHKACGYYNVVDLGRLRYS